MSTDAWQTLIDRAAKQCGTQSALAEKLGTSRQELSNAKHGRRAMPAEQIQRLAELLGEPVDHVGSLHDLARVQSLSPYRGGLAKAALVFFSAIGSGGATGAPAVPSNAFERGVDTMHIVDMLRGLFALMARATSWAMTPGSTRDKGRTLNGSALLGC